MSPNLTDQQKVLCLHFIKLPISVITATILKVQFVYSIFKSRHKDIC